MAQLCQKCGKQAEKHTEQLHKILSLLRNSILGFQK